MVVEQAFAARNIQSALRIGEGRGVILACAVRSGAEVVQYAASSARKSLLGHGGADKTQVQAMVKILLPGVQIAGADAADALAVAICHAHHATRAGGFIAQAS